MHHRLWQYVNDEDQEVYTWCECGKLIWAENRDDQDEMAESLGYKSTWAMNREHDRTHWRISRALGMESPTLMRIVHGDSSFASNELVALEEAAVLSVQKFWNAARKARHG